MRAVAALLPSLTILLPLGGGPFRLLYVKNNNHKTFQSVFLLLIRTVKAVHSKKITANNYTYILAFCSLMASS